MTSTGAGSGTQGSDPGSAPGRPSGESGATKLFRHARWTLAFVISATALGFLAYWLASGTRAACQVETVVPVNAQHASATTTTTCGLPSVSDFVYVIAVVGLLLLPDAKSLSFGGLSFERLTNQVEQQTREIGHLRQQVSTTINIVADPQLLSDMRSGVRDLKERLAQSRSSLPTDDRRTRDTLRDFDDIARRIDTASATEVVSAANTGHQLLNEARRLAEEQLRESTAVTDADVAQSVEAEAVLSDILGDASPPGAPSASTPTERRLER